VLRQLVLVREVADVGQLREGGAQVRRAGLVPARELGEHCERAARAADAEVGLEQVEDLFPVLVERESCPCE
jgi:hypothetical protein